VLLDMLVIGRDGFAILLPPPVILRFTQFLHQCLPERGRQIDLDARAASSRSQRVLTLVALFGKARWGGRHGSLLARRVDIVMRMAGAHQAPHEPLVADDLASTHSADPGASGSGTFS
jgi:hypothetical protein